MQDRYKTHRVACGAFLSTLDAFPNLTVKKISKAVLQKCEYGEDNYRLEIQALPERELVGGVLPGESSRSTLKRRQALEQQLLFDEEEQP